jgi:hypothetical protein
MDANWAEENLQVIRTLMERSALYRRRLAPLMLLAGAGALIGGLLGPRLEVESARQFVLLWGGVAACVLLGAGWITRGQAIRAGEVFWTAPTRRVLEALLPSLVVGGLLGGCYVVGPQATAAGSKWLLVVSWCVLLGLGLHSAGFYVSRGIRRLGWAFIVAGIVVALALLRRIFDVERVDPGFAMATVFGGLHLVSAIYLFFTEEKETRV